MDSLLIIGINMLHDYQISAIQNMDNFLASDDRLYRLFWDCGLGKSYVLARWIALHPDQKFLYVSVTHKICDNFHSELLDAGVTDVSHYRGKKDLCLREEEERYYPGCRCEKFIRDNDYTWSEKDGHSYCTLKCPYKRQPINNQVILTVFELMSKFSDDGRIFIIDESPEKLAVKQAYGYADDLVLDQVYHWEDKWGEEQTYYTNVQLKVTFRVHNYRTWKLKMFFDQTRRNCVVAYPHSKGKGFDVYGRNFNLIPPLASKIIFACATTSIPFMEEMLGISANVVDEQRKTLLNTVIEVNHQWTKALSEEKFDWFMNTFLPSLSDNPDDIFISTKMMFAKQLTELGYHAPYHGNGRGINDYDKQYKYIIAYCRFGAPIEVNNSWVLLGFDKVLIKQKEISESLQTFHRCRAHLHDKTTPIILMTNKELGIDANIGVSLKALQKLSELDTLPSSLNKISKELHISKRDAKPARETYKVLYQ